MEVPSFKENHISLIPALQMLQKLGYTYLSPAEIASCVAGKRRMCCWTILCGNS